MSGAALKSGAPVNYQLRAICFALQEANRAAEVVAQYLGGAAVSAAESHSLARMLREQVSRALRSQVNAIAEVGGALDLPWSDTAEVSHV